MTEGVRYSFVKFIEKVKDPISSSLHGDETVVMYSHAPESGEALHLLERFGQVLTITALKGINAGKSVETPWTNVRWGRVADKPKAEQKASGGR